MKKQKLTAKEYRETLSFLRTWAPKNCHENIAKLVKYIVFLENALTQTERELREISQPKMFETEQAIRKQALEPIMKEKNWHDRGERIYRLFENEEALTSYMRLSGKTKEELVKEANSWAYARGMKAIEL